MKTYYISFTFLFFNLIAAQIDAQIDAGPEAAEFMEDRARVCAGEQVAGVAQGQLALVGDGLGEVELAVDVGGAHLRVV